MEISFCDLRAKEVVNIFDGKQLGHVVDLIFDTTCARVLGIVVPGEKSIINFFKSCTDIFIPYCRICKIGKDVILVDLNPSQQNIKILENEPNNNSKVLNEIEKYNYNSNKCENKSTELNNEKISTPYDY